VNLGIAMGIKPNALVMSAFAAMFHDIGKVKLPKELLDSTQKLSGQQRKQFESHVKFGEDILKDLNIPAEIIAIVNQHHELGGIGYPYGLTAKQMTQLGQLLAVADRVAAMMEERAYKKGESPQQVVAYLNKHLKEGIDFKSVQAFQSISGQLNTRSFANNRVAQIQQIAEDFRQHTAWTTLSLNTTFSGNITPSANSTFFSGKMTSSGFASSFRKSSTSDKASVSKREPPGGIDLNAANLDLRIRRDGKGMLIPVNQKEIDDINIEGLSPVIIYIKPAQGLPIFPQLQNTANSVNG
jgi:putative nucleotidyltransferase with HDIG domain